MNGLYQTAENTMAQPNSHTKPRMDDRFFGANSAERAFHNGAICAFLSSATEAIDGAIAVSDDCRADELHHRLRHIRAELADLLPILTMAG